ncbi:hypothetical protein [Streptomyces sp. NPDC047061]|uniref:hypothetical protein n=1 Tax=Streptomyces sp. NPDC047061 TaxID=3154605 RepID=UPI0033CECBC5
MPDSGNLPTEPVRVTVLSKTHQEQVWFPPVCREAWSANRGVISLPIGVSPVVLAAVFGVTPVGDGFRGPLLQPVTGAIPYRPYRPYRLVQAALRLAALSATAVPAALLAAVSPAAKKTFEPLRRRFVIPLVTRSGTGVPVARRLDAEDLVDSPDDEQAPADPPIAAGRKTAV